MKHIIQIHNRNNEEAWHEVLKWEALHARSVGPLSPPWALASVSPQAVHQSQTREFQRPFQGLLPSSEDQTLDGVSYSTAIMPHPFMPLPLFL